MIWHGYILVEIQAGAALDLRDDKRGAIRAALARLNRAWDGKQPAALFQARVSRDGRKAIYELTAHVDALAPDRALAAVAGALNVPEKALRRAIRYRFFARGGTWQQSRRAAVAYLAQHRAEWEETSHDARA